MLPLENCTGPTADDRQVRLAVVTTLFDISTDILVASFPVILLWNIRISTRQKIGLGAMLSLSLIMASLAIVRISGIRLDDGHVDVIWLAFWGQQECSVAMIMISITAFRSFFVANAQKRDRSLRYSNVYWPKRLLQKSRFGRSDEANRRDLDIEIPSLTGVQTIIRGPTKSKPTSPLTLDSNQELLLFDENKSSKTALGHRYPPETYKPINRPFQTSVRDERA